MMAVRCLKADCDRHWPRDPALEIACPDCKAPIGVGCRRPSGHRAFGSCNVHAARDLAADAAGHYGVCPSGRCGRAAVVSMPGAQPDLFGGAA